MIERFKPKSLVPYHPSDGDINTALKVLTTLYEREELKSELIESGLLRKLKNPNLFGFEAEEIKVTTRLVDALMQRASLDGFDLDPVLTALTKTKSELVKTPRKINLPKIQIPRLRIDPIAVRRMLLIGGLTWVMGNFWGYPTYYDHFTEEGRAAMAIRIDERAKETALREAKEKEEKLAKDLEFERTSTLGLTPSSPSTNNWRVSYPLLDPKVTYREVKGEHAVKTVSSGNWMSVPRSEGGNETPNIYLFARTTSDGKNAPGIGIRLATGNNQEWLLRREPSTDIDTRVVQFENIKEGKIVYLAVTLPKQSEKIVQIALMEKVES